MTREELIEMKEKVIHPDELEEIKACDAVKVIRDNGMSATHPGKRWYVVVFKEGDGINVYVGRDRSEA